MEVEARRQDGERTETEDLPQTHSETNATTAATDSAIRRPSTRSERAAEKRLALIPTELRLPDRPGGRVGLMEPLVARAVRRIRLATPAQVSGLAAAAAATS